MKDRRPAWLYVLCLCSGVTFAQIPANNDPEVIIDDPAGSDDVIVLPIGIPTRSTHTIELGASPLLYTIVPIEPAPATLLSPGTELVFKLSPELASVSNVRWFHNDRPVATTSVYSVPSLTPSHSGTYRASFDGHPEFGGTDWIAIRVATADHQRLTNLSTRVTISPSTPRATFGFVIHPRASSSFRGHPVLIRVVGPALADYGVSSTLPDPVYTLRTSEGADITPGMFFTQEVIDGKSSEQRYREYVDLVSTVVGAFPVVTKLQFAEPPRNLADVAELSPGAYTLTVHSESNATGELLVEIYDAWNDPALRVSTEN